MSEPKVKGSAPLHAVAIALVCGLAILSLKFVAFSITGSQVILSDALESIVNVLASAFSLLAVKLSNTPPDRNHPYGHGKTEFLAASFEGGLITFAAVLIWVDSLQKLFTHHELQGFQEGIFLVFLSGLANGLLGFYLVGQGRRYNSSALVAGGTHALSDTWTSIASITGVALVQATGLSIIDPLFALAAGTFLGWSGIRIIRHSLAELLDEEDPDILARIATALSSSHMPGLIGVHKTRVMRVGNHHIIDAHVVVAEFWDVAKAHDQVISFERAVLKKYPYSAEFHFHLDPCRQQFCRRCDLEACPIRKEAFESRIEQTAEEIRAERSTR